MNRRSLFKAGGLAATTARRRAGMGSAYVPTHNWDRDDFGYDPTITDRLNQGSFPQYPAEAVFLGGGVVMGSTPSPEVVPNCGGQEQLLGQRKVAIPVHRGPLL